MSEQQGIDTVARETGKLKEQLADIKEEMNEKFDTLDEEAWSKPSIRFIQHMLQF